MSSVLNTSTMKSPPLDVCVTGSLDGGMVSTAASRGPGAAALRFARVVAASSGLAFAGAASAAAPTTVAPFRKMRRLESNPRRRFDMVSSRETPRQLRVEFLFFEVRAGVPRRQDERRNTLPAMAAVLCRRLLRLVRSGIAD